MRGGSSRGPYFNQRDLPKDRATLSEVLLSVVGSGHPLNIDGIGGGAAVTTKVAILSRSEDDWADIDYLFAQVGVEDRLVDYKPTCGNILSGAGAAALEMDLFPITGDETIIRIRAVNTGARIVAKIQTPRGAVTYQGDASIDGVPGTAAPVELMFMDTVGGATGALLPTGNLLDEIDGIGVTCMDVGMPMVIGRARDFGLTGDESAAQLDENKELYGKIESIRIQAGELMGMGDVTKSVVPKFAVIATPHSGGTFSARYFMPWKCHPTMAVTGAQCLAGCALTPGTVADGLIEIPDEVPAPVTIEHPMGHMQVIVDYSIENSTFVLKSAGLIRTARKLAAGEVYIPADIWK